MKYASIIVTLSLALIGGIMGYGRLTADQQNTKEAVKKNEAKIEEVKKEAYESKMVNREQAVIQQNTIEIMKEFRDEIKQELKEIKKKAENYPKETESIYVLPNVERHNRGD